MHVYEKAPAKINLSLDVLHKRADGFHEVEMIMTMVDLSDRVTLTLLEEDRILISSQVGSIPLDEKNIAFQAAKRLKQAYGVKAGVHVHIEKHIPVAAGLAGGSSDCAATLRGLNRLWNLNLSTEDLLEHGAALGSDVPFCITGGTALATGRGEKLTPIAAPPSCWVVIAKPPINVSTQDVYRRLKADEIEQHPSIPAMMQAIDAQDYTGVCAAMGNVLEAVTLPMVPDVAHIKDVMLKLGADAAMMSGSGPTVFGLADKEAKAQRISNGLRGFCKEVYVVRMLT
jgi:4-diphosphocytidyl-2-C-methyl-D-erythritol kinase